MILGALVDAGLPIRVLEETVARLRLPGCVVRARRVRRLGLRATYVTVAETEKIPPLSTLAQIRKHLNACALDTKIRKQALEIFNRMALAEARVHGTRANRVHFHEIGAVDTLVDVVGTVAGLLHLGIDRLITSPIHVGWGTVTTAHGEFPVPAPATAELLRDCPIYATGVVGELTTPTGAAILSTLTTEFSTLPQMQPRVIGIGAGQVQRVIPNVLRLWIGTPVDAWANDEIVQIETNIDDMNPQNYEPVCEQLFSAGALDVFLTPVIMKRGRPGVLLTVLAPPVLLDRITRLMLSRTTTLGVRVSKMARKTLTRRVEKVRTPYGPMRIKVAYQEERPLRAASEWRDVQRLTGRMEEAVLRRAAARRSKRRSQHSTS